MATDLNALEGDVRAARERLKTDLDVLRSPETFTEFKDDVLAGARDSGESIVANVKGAANERLERFVAEIKERAAANPVAVGAIAAGLAWHMLRKPPITTMLVGFGLFSLLRTKPGVPAPGAEAVYRAADMAIEAKGRIEQWGAEASVAVGRAKSVVIPAVAETAQRWSAGVSEAVSQARSTIVPAVAETAERWGAGIGGAVSQAKSTIDQTTQRLQAGVTDAVSGATSTIAAVSDSTQRWRDGISGAFSEATNSAQALVAKGSQSVRDNVPTAEQRDMLLLFGAAAAIAAAVGIVANRQQ